MTWTYCPFHFSSTAAVWHHQKGLLRQHQGKTNKRLRHLKMCSFEVLISLLLIAWVVKRHFYCRCVSCPSRRVCLLLLHVYCYAGLADWNLWVRTEGCGHHVAWQQGKWDFLKGLNRDKQTLLKGTNNVLMHMQTQSQESVFHLFLFYVLYTVL